MVASALILTWIRETRRKITCSFCTVLFWDLTYNRRIIVYHTLKIRISRWEGYRISSPIGWRNSRVISLENPNSDWTIPHNSAISRGIYEQRKDEIENGFLLSFTDSGISFSTHFVLLSGMEKPPLFRVTAFASGVLFSSVLQSGIW